MSITLILAMDEGGLIGRDGDLPWRLPKDLRHFRAHTLNKAVLMGRATFESLGRPLDQRDNWVLSRRDGFHPEGVTVFRDAADALARARDEDRELMVIGGARVYDQLLPAADRILLTRVHARLGGDTWFPDPELDGWCATTLEVHGADERHAWPFSFLDLKRAWGSA